jgi:[protein-PII] uridylyltransferase
VSAGRARGRRERLGALLRDADGTPARLDLTLFKGFLAVERGRIRARHAAGAGGLGVAHELADLVDAVAWHLFQAADAACSGGARRGSDGCVLVALGGYGRHELCPASDVDVMFLYPGRLDGYVEAVVPAMVQALWDVGFSVGHSARSIADGLRLAEGDPTTLTSLLEARPLAGRREIFAAFRARFQHLLTPRRVQAFVEHKLAERAARHARAGGTVFVQEPNVKESPGGLRDLQMALWLAQVRQGAGTLERAAAAGLLPAERAAACRAAHDFLLRVRHELHYQGGGRADVLTLSEQSAVAARLGFRDTPGAHAVMRFMQRYYLSATTIYLGSNALAARCARRPGRTEAIMQRLRARELGDGLVEMARQIQVARGQEDCFAQDPVLLLKLFWYALETGAGLAPETQDLIRANLGRIDDAFRRSSRARSLFLAILREARGAAAALRRMHELGVLGAYLPEFGKLTCLVQYDAYHRYTVDEHTFVALEQLEGLDQGTHQSGEEFRSIWRELRRPETFRLALLLHDIGKGEGAEHVARGVALLDGVLDRLGLPAADAEEVRFLVAHHLTMPHIAERRDLEDEALLIDFAQTVQDVERLKRLYLLTYCDLRAVGPGMWTAWKATLLWELFIKTHTLLTRGLPEGEGERAKAAAVARQLVAELGAEFPPEVIEDHLAKVPVRYLLGASPARVAAHLRLARQVGGDREVAFAATPYPLSGYAEVSACAYGRQGRFAGIVGALTANGINILSAQLFTRADGLVLRTFRVDDGRGAAVEDPAIWARFGADLEAVVAGRVEARDLIRERRREVLRAPSRTGPAPPTRVEFDNLVSEAHTVIDVRTQDRLGLLYLLASTLADLGVDVALAKITTEGDQVVDVFYATDRGGAKIVSPARQEAIRAALARAIGEGLQ